MDVGTFGSQVLFIGALVWVITAIVKGFLPGMAPQAISLIVAVLLGAVAYMSGYLTGNWFQIGGEVVLYSLTANAAHNYLAKAGLSLFQANASGGGGGGSSSGGGGGGGGGAGK